MKNISGGIPGGCRREHSFVWWGLLIDILMAISAFGMSFMMAALGIRIVARRGRCRACDYLLTGLTEPRCPDCGTAFDASEVEADGAVEEA